MKFEITKTEKSKGRIILTVNVSKWWGINIKVKQFINSNDIFKLNNENVWYEYPSFKLVSLSSKEHNKLVSFDRKYTFENEEEKKD